jgi:hypothetical protein
MIGFHNSIFGYNTLNQSKGSNTLPNVLWPVFVSATFESTLNLNIMKRMLLAMAVFTGISVMAQNKKITVTTQVSGSMQTFSLYQKQVDNTYALVQEQDEDGGKWTFDSLSNGTYRVHIDMAYTKYLPTWYPSAAVWNEAQDIDLATDSMGVSVSMIPNPSVSGPATITGQLNEGLLKTAGDPLKNTRVVINDGNDAFVKMVNSNDSGKFVVSNLPVGSYKILIDIINVSNANPKTVVLDSNNINAAVDLTVNATGTVNTGLLGSSVKEPLPVRVFPNPTSDRFQLTTDELVEVSVFNLSGTLVAKGKSNKNEAISIGDLPNGMYIITFIVSELNNPVTLKLIKQ